MAQLKLIARDNLAKLFEELIKSGKQVIAPRKKGAKFYFAPVKSLSEVEFDFVQTVLSAKSQVFPRTEELFHFIVKGGDILTKDGALNIPETVIFGVRPCDAAAFEYMKDFFLKENPDYHFAMRLEKTTLIALSCKKSDEYCFCTSVGLSPGSTRGSDLTFTDIGDGKFYVESVSDKGDALINKSAALFEATEMISKTHYVADVPVAFDAAQLTARGMDIYKEKKWNEHALACLACGACAFSCPTCTCFDIQDETTPKGGSRYRIWDACAQPLFTLHASGHNPRHAQHERWRHRVLHKFKYSVDNLGAVSCVGCGRCARACPAGMNILSHITNLLEA